MQSIGSSNGKLNLIRQALRRLAGRRDQLARKARARLLGEILQLAIHRVHSAGAACRKAQPVAVDRNATPT